MHGKVLFIFLIVPLIESHDVAIGLNNYGKKIFEEERQASPAIWRQKENVTIEAAENEVITKVIIIDMRPEKDGDATIIDGGEGKKNVTIELKSPTVLRGYDFYIEVFSAPYIQNDNETTQTSSPSPPDCNNQATSTPQQRNTNSADSTRPVRTTNENNDTNNERSTLHTSVVHSVTSTKSLSDETTTIINNISTISDILPDSVDTVKDDPALTEIKSNETDHAENTQDGSILSTTSDNIETTTLEYATSKNENTNGKDIPDFPDMIGFNDDETRHAREAKDFETTSIGNDITTGITTEITTVDPDNTINDGSTQNSSDLNLEAKDTRYPRESNEQAINTEAGVTDGTTELITILSPESENSKAVQDLAEISGTEADVTSQRSEQDMSTERGITEISTEITTITPDEESISEKGSEADDTRQAREANEVTDDVNDSSTSMDILTSTITEDYSGDGSDLSYSNNKEETTDNTTTEENGLPVDLTPPAITNADNNPLYIFGNTDNTNYPAINQQDFSATPPIITANQPDANIAKEQVLRNSRNSPLFGNMMDPSMVLNEPNYPLFVSPSLPGDSEQPSSESDYVYVPLIAIVSNSSFPSFQNALESLMQQSKLVFQTGN